MYQILLLFTPLILFILGDPNDTVNRIFIIALSFIIPLAFWWDGRGVQ
jgi:hypothetical protein